METSSTAEELRTRLRAVRAEETVLMDRLRMTRSSLDPSHGQSDVLVPDDEIMQLRRAFGLLAAPHTREHGVFCAVSELLAETSSRAASAVHAPTTPSGRSQDVALTARRARGALVRRAIVAVCGEGPDNVRRGLELAFPRADWDRLRRGLGDRAAWAHERAPAAASARASACSREPSADGDGLIAFVHDLRELETLQVRRTTWIFSTCVCDDVNPFVVVCLRALVGGYHTSDRSDVRAQRAHG